MPILKRVKKGGQSTNSTFDSENSLSRIACSLGEDGRGTMAEFQMVLQATLALKLPLFFKVTRSMSGQRNLFPTVKMNEWVFNESWKNYSIANNSTGKSFNFNGGVFRDIITDNGKRFRFADPIHACVPWNSLYVSADSSKSLRAWLSIKQASELAGQKQYKKTMKLDVQGRFNVGLPQATRLNGTETKLEQTKIKKPKRTASNKKKRNLILDTLLQFFKATMNKKPFLYGPNYTGGRIAESFLRALEADPKKFPEVMKGLSKEALARKINRHIDLFV